MDLCASDPTRTGCPCDCDQARVERPGGGYVHCLGGAWRGGIWGYTPGAVCTDGGAMDALVCPPGSTTPGCPCPRIGDIDCRSTVNQVRCTETGWSPFSDGECMPPLPHDAGGDCTATPLEDGCPCSCEQARECIDDAVYFHCLSGRWRRGFWECTPGAVCDDAGP